MIFWITFNYTQQSGVVDTLAAKIDGTHVERWWNKQKMPDATLEHEYPYIYISQLHPMDIQQGVFMTAGMNAGNISGLRITNEELTLDEIFGGRK
jgi:hypothetical protein